VFTLVRVQMATVDDQKNASSPQDGFLHSHLRQKFNNLKTQNDWQVEQEEWDPTTNSISVKICGQPFYATSTSKKKARAWCMLQFLEQQGYEVERFFNSPTTTQSRTYSETPFSCINNLKTKLNATLTFDMKSEPSTATFIWKDENDCERSVKVNAPNVWHPKYLREQLSMKLIEGIQPRLYQK
jgi:hypothetical protein